MAHKYLPNPSTDATAQFCIKPAEKRGSILIAVQCATLVSSGFRIGLLTKG